MSMYTKLKLRLELDNKTLDRAKEILSTLTRCGYDDYTHIEDNKIDCKYTANYGVGKIVEAVRSIEGLIESKVPEQVGEYSSEEHHIDFPLALYGYKGKIYAVDIEHQHEWVQTVWVIIRDFHGNKETYVITDEDEYKLKELLDQFIKDFKR